MPGTYLTFFFFFFLFAFVAGVVFPVFLAGFFLAAFFATFLAVCFFVVFFFAPFVAAAFLAALFLGGAFLLPVVPDFLEDLWAALSVVFLLRILAGFLLLGTAASTGFVSTSCWMEIFGSATTAATTRTGSGSAATVSTTSAGAGSGVAGAAEAGSSAFHSRKAWASRGDTSGYSASSPTVGRIFQERAHLVPTAFLTTTATPGTSFSLNASAGASSLVTIAFEVMLTSARSISNSVSKIFLSETYTSGDASSEEPMFLAARSTSSAPVTTRRTLRMVSHFVASASSRNVSKLSGNSVRCTDGSASGL